MRRLNTRKIVLTVGEEGGSIPLKPCTQARDDNKERAPENTPPREVRLEGTVIEQVLPVESLFVVPVVYTTEVNHNHLLK